MGSATKQWVVCGCGEPIPVEAGEAVCLACRAVVQGAETTSRSRFTGRFKASSVGQGWEHYTTLAELCESANLTRRQAEIVLLFSRGWSWAQIAPVVRATRANARRYFLIAVNRIARSRSHIRQDRREWAKSVLWCLREVNSNPSTPVYDERGRPVAIRARMVTAEDLGGEEADLLAEMVEDLRGVRTPEEAPNEPSKK